MTRLPKQKRQQLILTVLVTVTVLFGIWYGVIRAQRANIQSIGERGKAAGKKLANIKQTIARAQEIESELGVSGKVLARLEEQMGSGDLYAWAITKIREFKTPYKVEIPQFSQIDGPKDSNLLPDFPYKQASLTVAGTGHFHDIGTFIADFENQNPFMRICNLAMEPAPAVNGADTERLAFRMEIVALVRPSNPGAN